MKKLVAVLMSFLMIMTALPMTCFADTNNDAKNINDRERVEIITNETWTVKSVRPKSSDEQFGLLNSIISDFMDIRNRIVYVESYDWEKYGPDYSVIRIHENGDTKLYVVKMKYIEPPKELVDEAIAIGKRIEKEKEFILDDLELIGYYNKYGPRELHDVEGSTDELVNKTSIGKNIKENYKNISVKLQMEGFQSIWNADHVKNLVTGGVAINTGVGPVVVFNQGIPCYTFDMSLIKKNVVYVPEDSKDCLADAKKRIASYLGHNNFKLEVGGKQNSLNNSKWEFNSDKKLDESKLADDNYYILTLNGDTYLYFLYRMPEESLVIPNNNSKFERLAGADRFETAIMTADAMKKEKGTDKFDTIIIADGLGYADALSGTYLAAAKEAPILTVGKDSTSQKTVKNYITKNLKSKGTVYILGGNNAVSNNFGSSLSKAGIKVKRLGGSDRYDTNLLILKEAGVNPKEVLVCSATGFADSLSASATGKAILLVGNNLTTEQKTFLSKQKDEKYYVIGGNKAVSSTVEKQLKSYGIVERITGANRFETSVAVADKFFGKNVNKAVLAYGLNFPDGLSGGPLAYTMNVPLLLVTSNDTLAAERYTEKKGIEHGVVLGGSKLISDKAVDRIFKTKPETKPEQKPSKPEKPQKPNKEPIWVVDKPAWDEVVEDKTKPIYDWVDTWVVVMRDGSEKVFYDEDEMLNFVYNNGRLVSSWRTGEQEKIFVGYEKVTIHHPAEGHWEYI